MRNAASRFVTPMVLGMLLGSTLFAQPVRVAGTTMRMMPPEGFSVAQQYPGFERPDVQAAIMVTELPVAAREMIRSMTVPALAIKGIAVISARDLTINDNPARLLHARQKTSAGEVLKWMLIAGDARKTFMLVGTFQTGSVAEVGDSIRQSLLTATWDAAPSTNPFEGLTFRVTPTKRLRLATRLSNMLMFTESGTTGSPGSTEALFVVGHSIGRGQIGDLRTFAEARAKQTNAIKQLSNMMGRDIRIAELDAYELEADGTHARSGSAMRLYQVIAPDDSGYYILQGLCRADRADEILPEFRALAASFRIAP